MKRLLLEIRIAFLTVKYAYWQWRYNRADRMHVHYWAVREITTDAKRMYCYWRLQDALRERPVERKCR